MTTWSRAGPTACAPRPAPLQLTLFRRGRVERARTAARQLSESAGDAHRQLLDLLDGRSRTVPPVSESKTTMLPRPPEGERVSERPQLVAIPGYADRQADVHFCGHCATAALVEVADPASRVCGRCGLGLLIGAQPELAPGAGDPFVLVDSTLSVCGVSAQAEQLLDVSETRAVNRHLTEFLVPADAEASGPGDLVNLVVRAARGVGEMHEVVLRPTAEFGIRHWARIGPCGPPRAALIVLGDGIARG